MADYALKPKSEAKVAKAYGRGLRISTKHSTIVCKELTGMNLQKGKLLLEGMVGQKRSLDGKFYPNVAEELLNLIKSAESNAEFKGLDANKLIIHATSHKGFTFFRPRNFKIRRQQRKVSNLQVVLQQR